MSLLRSLFKKVRQLEKSTPPPVVAVVTNIRCGRMYARWPRQLILLSPPAFWSLRLPHFDIFIYSVIDTIKEIHWNTRNTLEIHEKYTETQEIQWKYTRNTVEHTLKKYIKKCLQWDTHELFSPISWYVQHGHCNVFPGMFNMGTVMYLLYYSELYFCKVYPAYASSKRFAFILRFLACWTWPL